MGVPGAWHSQQSHPSQSVNPTRILTVSEFGGTVNLKSPTLRIPPRLRGGGCQQRAALEAWRTHDRQGTVILPTGSGKTFLGLQAIADAGVSALVITPTIDLMNQWHATLTNAFGGQLTAEIGVLGGGSHEIAALTVTTYDSAYRYIDEYGDRFGLLITDETHHLAAETYLQIPEMTIAPYRLGLTATYERADGREELLEDRMGPVVYEEVVDNLAGEFLSEYETIQMSVELTSEERSAYDDEYQLYRDYVDTHDFDLWKEQGYAEFLKRTSYDPQGRRALIAKQRAERIARTATKKLDTLDNLLKRHHDDRVIVFTANNDFAYDISREFVLPCITHQTDTDERTEILERFRTGEYSMLATSQVLDEGIDVPAANVGIILSGSASKRQYAQRLGRILRPTDDRQPARLYEIITTDTMETYVSQRRRNGVSSSADG
ncbi:DNA repair helicase [Halorubrum sp. C191]|nr:DNA repair helicase [Halorubrum sp. C191]